MSDAGAGQPVEVRRAKVITTPGVARGKAAPQPALGQKFGRLTVVSHAGQNAVGNNLWTCRCDCGGSIVRRTGYLNLVKLPGCDECSTERRGAVMRTHGETPRSNARTRSPLYTAWCNMRNRCGNPKNRDWHNYGGKGIRVCDDWLDFDRFRAWASQTGFVNGLTLDRVDASKGYQPDNCEWVTRSENSKRMWAAQTPEQRTAEGKRRQSGVEARMRQQAINDYRASSAAFGEHFPIEALWGAA